MHGDREAMKKLSLRAKSIFFEANDTLFSFGEINTSVFVLVQGWVTLCIGEGFKEDEEDEEDVNSKALSVARRIE